MFEKLCIFNYSCIVTIVFCHNLFHVFSSISFIFRLYGPRFLYAGMGVVDRSHEEGEKIEQPCILNAEGTLSS